MILARFLGVLSTPPSSSESLSTAARFLRCDGDTERLLDLDRDRLRDLPELRLRLRFELARLPERLRDPLFDRERDFERLPLRLRLRLRRELARLPERLRLRLLEPLLDLERDLERLPLRLRRELARLPERLRLREPLLDLDLDLDFERLPLRLRLLEPLFERERDLDRLPLLDRERDLDRLPERLLEPLLDRERDLDFDREPDRAFEGDREPPDLALDTDLDRDLDREPPDFAFDGDRDPDLDRLFLDRFEPTLRLRLLREAGVPLRDLSVAGAASPFFTGLPDFDRLLSLDSTLSSCVVFCCSPPVVSAAGLPDRDRERFELAALPLRDLDRDLAGLELLERDRDFRCSSSPPPTPSSRTGVASRETD